MAESSDSIDPKRAARIAAVVQAVAEYELTESQAWNDLDALSSGTSLDDLEVDPEGIIIEGDKFRGAMSVYVVLRYGGNSKDAFQTSDAFRGQFEGHFENDLAAIDNVSIDTSPFFEGEAL